MSTGVRVYSRLSLMRKTRLGFEVCSHLSPSVSPTPSSNGTGIYCVEQITELQHKLVQCTSLWALGLTLASLGPPRRLSASLGRTSGRSTAAWRCPLHHRLPCASLILLSADWLQLGLIERSAALLRAERFNLLVNVRHSIADAEPGMPSKYNNVSHSCAFFRS